MSQQTARTRRNDLVRRAAAVSAGAFALCLAAATPAMADLTPLPDPDLTPVTDALSPVTDVVDPVVPVSSTLTEVEQTAGISTKTETTKPKPSTKPSTKPTSGNRDTTTSTSTRDSRHRTAQRDAFRDPGPAAVSPAYVWSGPVADMPGLRSALETAALDAEAPAVAAAATPKHSVISLAGGTLRDMGDAGTPIGRTVLVIISTLTIGTLAGGHVKAAQDRLMASVA